MKKNKFLLILILSLFIFEKGWSASETQDSTNSFNSFNLFKIKNHWLNSGNLAGSVFNTRETIGIVDGGYELTDGNYHLMREASHQESYSLYSESYQVIKDIHFYGNINYLNSDEHGNLYTGVSNPYRRNPYIIGDSIPGANTHKESFTLSGGVAKNINDKFSIGFLAKYHIAEGAKQKDPRPRIIVTDISISPSFIMHLPKSNLGMDLGYSNRKEDISYKQVVTNAPDPTYFMFKGMGFYSYEIGETKNRFCNQNIVSAGIQYDTKIFNYQSLTEIRGSYSNETTEDGSNTIKKEDAGDWKTYKVELDQQLTKQKSDAIQKLTFNSFYFNGDGTEYIQDAVLNEDNTTEYITLSKNLKLNRKEFHSCLSFDYLKLYNLKKINWESSVFIGFNTKTEKYYYIPEIFNANYSNIEAGAGYEKNFYFRKFRFSPRISVKYNYNLSQEINLSNDPTITKRQNKELYLHDFEYYTADQVNLAAVVNCGYQLVKSNAIDELFIKIGYQYWQVFDTDYDKGILTAKIGFMF